MKRGTTPTISITVKGLSVKTVNEMEDSPLPMSAAGVHVIVGNINTILSTI